MNFTLLVIQGRPSGKKLVFPPGDYYFGRGEECHVRPDSEWVSRQHCVLHVTSEGAHIQDLGSRNGTLVNGELVVRHRQLVPGDHLQVGPLVFEVQPEPSPATGPQVNQPTANLQKEPTVEVAPQEARESSPDSTDNHPALPPEQTIKHD
jgi:pSer/pThr/pTyr-binding forkhead associated (FHA) protein